MRDPDFSEALPRLILTGCANMLLASARIGGAYEGFREKFIDEMSDIVHDLKATSIGAGMPEAERQALISTASKALLKLFEDGLAEIDQAAENLALERLERGLF